MPPAAPDQPASAADERPDAPAREAGGAAAGSRSPSLAPYDAEAPAARAAGTSTSTPTRRPCPENATPHLTYPSPDPTAHGHHAEPRNPSYRHLHARAVGTGAILVESHRRRAISNKSVCIISRRTEPVVEKGRRK